MIKNIVKVTKKLPTTNEILRNYAKVGVLGAGQMVREDISKNV